MANILIVDDNADDRKLIRHLLALTPALPENAPDIREAGRLAEVYAELRDPAWKPDVILLDLHLPDGPGPFDESWQAVRELSTHAPVIVVSASSLTDDPNLGHKAHAAGAAGFTSKELIMFSPENLARQLDWVMCKAARSLAEDVKYPEARPELGDYNPNSVPALIARLIQTQESMHQQNQSAAIQYKNQLDRIEQQTTKTNGRVNELETREDGLEEVNRDREKAAKTALKVGSALLTLILFLFGATLKERAFIDNLAVRKLADEQIEAAAKKTAAHPAPTVP